MAKICLNMLIKWVKMEKINKITNFPACTYKSQNVAQSQQNFAPLHDGETVTFRNSEPTYYWLSIRNIKPYWIHLTFVALTFGFKFSKIGIK